LTRARRKKSGKKKKEKKKGENGGIGTEDLGEATRRKEGVRLEENPCKQTSRGRLNQLPSPQRMRNLEKGGFRPQRKRSWGICEY